MTVVGSLPDEEQGTKVSHEHIHRDIFPPDISFLSYDNWRECLEGEYTGNKKTYVGGSVLEMWECPDPERRTHASQTHSPKSMPWNGLH